MGIKVPHNEVFEELTIMKRHNGSEWIDCQFLRVYENGEWVDKWTASTPWTAYYYSDTIINSPAVTAQKYWSGFSWGFSQNDFGFGGYSNDGQSGNMNIWSKSEDGTNFLPTNGCQYLDYSMYCGTTSGWSTPSSFYLHGKKKDGTIELIRSDGGWLNSAWKFNGTNLDVSDYEYIRMYGTCTWASDVVASLGAYIEKMIFHD